MALSRIRLALMIGLMVLGASAWAEEVPVPDPTRLAADWWTYLAPAEAIEESEFKTRVGRLDQALLGLERHLEAGARIDIGHAIAAVRERLKSYTETRAATPAEPTALTPAANEYTLPSALQRFEQARGLEREIAAVGEDLAWQQDLLAAKRRQLSRAKVGYLELPTADPGRLEAGLAIVRDRLEIETAALTTQRGERRIQRLREDVQALNAELEAIPARLIAEPADTDRWRAQAAAAEKTAAELRKQIEAGSKGGAPLTADSDNLAARIEALRVIDLDIQATRQDLVARQAQIAESLITLIQGGAPQTLAELRAGLGDLLKEFDRKRKYWHRAKERARDLSAGAAGASDSAQKKLRDSVESVNLNLLKLDQQREATRYFQRLLEDRIRIDQGLAKQWLQETVAFVQNAWTGSAELLSATLFEVNETPVTTLGLIRVVFILAVALLLSTGIRHALSRLAERRPEVNQSSLYTLSRVIHYFILAIGIVVGLSSIGIDFTKFALIASALGVGIGFGLQTLVSNFVAGLIILFEKSLKVGDFVEIASGLTGEVREINMRSTLITTNDNVDILVPNSEFMNNEVTNWTLRDAYRRIRIPFGVAYGTEKELVEKAVLEAANNVPWTLQSNIKRRKPQVWFVGFGDSSLNFELVVWLTPEAVKRPGTVNAKFLWEIDNKLREYDIEVPFPQRDLNLRGLFGAHDAQGLDVLRELLDRHKAAEQNKES